jgi:hypothetical protein
MVISFGNNGQFGNSYLASAFLAAHALENCYPIYILNLAPYARSLAMETPVPEVRLGSSVLLHRIGVNTAWVLSKAGASANIGMGRIRLVRGNGGNLERLAEQGRKGCVFHFGWDLRDRDALRMHVDTVRAILRPRSELISQAAAKFAAMKGDSIRVIGVHIRQGDYRTYRGGQYFFTQSRYQELTASAVRASDVPAGKTIIIAVSNEPLAWPALVGGARVESPSGTWMEDFLLLSMCDLIIGPPSTFSGSASFLGDVPWFQIKDKDAPFDPALARPALESGIRV